MIKTGIFGKLKSMYSGYPKEVAQVLEALVLSGFEAYVVGGCVRDLLMRRTPNDWDITTDAKPDEIQRIFPDSFYENTFGTVGVKTDSEDPALAVIEVTTYRSEGEYRDSRRPSEVAFVASLEEDLKRRDFTINALAMDQDGKLIDLFDGRADLDKRIIRAVGEANLRFGEDALRMLRAVRLAAQLHFDIDATTFVALQSLSSTLRNISAERIRDEFDKLIMTDHAWQGLELLKDTGLMRHVIPELLEGVNCGQNKHHIYTVWEHNARALHYACEQKYSLEVRLGCLLHDVGKPRVKRGDGPNSTFYNHEVVGAHMAAKIMARLKYPHDTADKVFKLVRWHLFYYNVGEVTETSVRRLVANIGKENVEDLLKVREGDRIGSGVPKARPYRIRHLQFMIDKVARDPISAKMLKMNGSELMELLELQPSPRVGMIIAALMNEVLDDPEKNTKDYLEQRSRQLNLMSDRELQELQSQGKSKIAEEEAKEIKQIQKRYKV